MSETVNIRDTDCTDTSAPPQKKSTGDNNDWLNYYRTGGQGWEETLVESEDRTADLLDMGYAIVSWFTSHQGSIYSV